MIKRSKAKNNQACETCKRIEAERRQLTLF